MIKVLIINEKILYNMEKSTRADFELKMTEDKKIECSRCGEMEFEDLVYIGGLCEICNSDMNG